MHRLYQFIGRAKLLLVTALVMMFVTVAMTLSGRPLSAQSNKDASTENFQNVRAAREALTRNRLDELLTAVGVSVPENFSRETRAESFREIELAWNADKQSISMPTSSSEQRLNPLGRISSVAASRQRAGSMARQRALELSPEQLFVAAINAENELKWWTLLPDPRILRAETSSVDGQLQGQIIYRASAEFVVNFPNDQDIKELRLYFPGWTGEEFALELVGTIPAR